MILCIFLYRNVAAVTLPTNGTTPAVFAFGDSTLDTGNNDYIISGLKSNFPPYGRDFMGGMPTGRFSNGRVPSNLIGSGYDPLTAELQSVLSLSDQLDLFKEYKSKINTAVGNEKTATLLSKILFIISMGSNDLAFSYFATPLMSAHYDIPAYTDFLLEFASTFFQKLYALGARVIGVASMPPIGCVPAQRTLGGGIERACSEAENQAAMLYNSKLSALVDSLNKRLPEALVIYIDIYNPFLSIIQDPAQYGFEVVDKGCCGTGIVEFGLLCNKHTPGTCNDASKFVSAYITSTTTIGTLILISFLADEGVGVKKILPAYMDPNLQLQDLLTGVCFASAGSGYDPLTPKLQYQIN
ncbi:hypothetical protein ACLB2K_000952 [Fragaria x ananassa]